MEKTLIKTVYYKYFKLSSMSSFFSSVLTLSSLELHARLHIASKLIL